MDRTNVLVKPRRFGRRARLIAAGGAMLTAGGLLAGFGEDCVALNATAICCPSISQVDCWDGGWISWECPWYNMGGDRDLEYQIPFLASPGQPGRTSFYYWEVGRCTYKTYECGLFPNTCVPGGTVNWSCWEGILSEGYCIGDL